MKKLYTFTILLLVAMSANSQTTDVITGLGSPSRIIIIDNIMYIADNTTSKILKTDFTEPNPVVIPVIENFYFAYGMHLSGSDIYFGTLNGISKFNYSDPSPTSEEIISGLSGPEGMVLAGDQLFVSEYFANQIIRADLSSPTPTTEVIVSVDAPDQLVLVGDFLYYAEYTNGRISKVDITIPNPTPIEVVSGLAGPTGMLLLGTMLYIAEYDGGTISKIDIADSNPTVTQVLSGFNGPTDIVSFDGELYIAEYDGGKISKFDESTLSINSVNTAQISISIYPNPTNNVLKVSGLIGVQSYALYSVTGSIINKGSVSNNETINVSNLSNGLYFLKLENGSNFKFIKN